MHKPPDNNYDVIIAGGGPAGASAAIHLARGGVRVLLIEQKKFPRAKLCGEFISPECQAHFEKLGVANAMISAGPTLLDETVFYSSNGHHVAVPSKWFSGGRAAYGLSRAVMDEVLLRSAQDAGVVVHEGASITEPLLDGERGERVAGVRVKPMNIAGEHHDFRAPITIDATGRARILSRKLGDGIGSKRPSLVAFKAHLKKTRVAAGACEIYFYPGGYGGLSTVESGTSNLCFIIDAQSVKRCNSDPNVVLRECVMKNRRAAQTLATAEVSSDWLSASWERFGRQRPSPAPGLLAIGDSAAFIDPFTGSGMLMAFESGELVAQTILQRQNDSSLEADYTAAYRQAFDSRLRICGLLRRAAFSPRLAELGIAICGASDRVRNRLARATRARSKSHNFLPQKLF
jgi:flavin-dependent dehydrogenase